MSIYKGTQLISGVATPVEAGRNIGQIISSLLPLTDAGLHLLDGTVISGNGIYSSFVNYISQLDLTANYFCSESEWQTSVSTYGVCGKFVYDATANTVRLPRVTGHVEGTLDASALGDLIEAGLPNIVGTIGTQMRSGAQNTINSGALYFTENNKYSYSNYGSGGSLEGTVNFNASRSNSIYGNSDTVQTQSILGYMYIVVATGAKTDIEVDIDNVVTDLNGKVDVSSMVDITDAGPIITNMVVPDLANIIRITPPYTTPCDGWVYLTVDGTLNGYCGVSIQVNGQGYGLIACANNQSGYSGTIGIAPKGAVVAATVGSGTISRYFIPSKGGN